MDCIVMAGGRPAEDDPLYSLTNGLPKALLRIGSRTMLDYVLSALRGSQYIGKIVVVGLDNYEGLAKFRDTVSLPDQDGMIANGFAALNWLAENQNSSEPILICTSDIPSITTPIVDEFITNCEPFNFAVYYSLVTREVMDYRFPNSKRTFVKLRDLEVAGGDIFIAKPLIAQSNKQLIETMASGRKQAWKIAKTVGPKTLIKFLFRRMTIKDIETVATNHIDAPVRVISFPHAEIAMDVDKPHHFEILSADLLKTRASY